VQAGEVCKPERYASRGDMQAGEMCRPKRCASRRDVQAGKMCKPERCASRRGVQVKEVCKPDRCADAAYCFVPIKKLIDKECVTVRVWNRSAASVFEIAWSRIWSYKESCQ